MSATLYDIVLMEHVSLTFNGEILMKNISGLHLWLLDDKMLMGYINLTSNIDILTTNRQLDMLIFICI